MPRDPLLRGRALVLSLAMTPALAAAADPSPSAPKAETQATADTREDLQRRADGIRAENASLQQRIAELEQRRAALDAKRADQDRKLADLRTRLDALEAARDD